MKLIYKLLSLVIICTVTSCASGYKSMEPSSLNYVSSSTDKGVTLHYKYDILDKKYAKKETKKGVKLVAVKLTNTSDRDLMFGSDIKLTYENGSEISVTENNEVFKTLKQSTASYLFYLLLTPLNLTTEDGNSSSTTPIGLVVGPGLAGGNMIAASSANAKFKEDLLTYDINGTVIKKGETKFGLIGVNSDSYDAIKVKRE